MEQEYVEMKGNLDPNKNTSHYQPLSRIPSDSKAQQEQDEQVYADLEKNRHIRILRYTPPGIRSVIQTKQEKKEENYTKLNELDECTVPGYMTLQEKNLSKKKRKRARAINLTYSIRILIIIGIGIAFFLGLATLIIQQVEIKHIKSQLLETVDEVKKISKNLSLTE